MKKPNKTTKKAMKDTRENVGVTKSNIAKCDTCPGCRALDDVDDLGNPSFACDVFCDYCSLVADRCNKASLIERKLRILQAFDRAKESYNFDVALVTAVMNIEVAK